MQETHSMAGDNYITENSLQCHTLPKTNHKLTHTNGVHKVYKIMGPYEPEKNLIAPSSISQPPTELEFGWIPPYKTKTIEPITISTRTDRLKWITAAKYNLFNLSTDQIILDFLTDSGTGAMSARQTGHLITGDETYAGSSSFSNFTKAVQNFTSFPEIIPVHQGRAAERILFSTLGVNSSHVIPSNGHFDTTQANIQLLGGTTVDFKSTDATLFQGGMDISKLSTFLKKNSDHVPFVMVTVTNNTYGGQPVSMSNLKKVSSICAWYGKPVFIDACRIAENAYFIKRDEPGFENSTISDIIREMLHYSDGMTMSAKKDGLSHIGGWIAVKDPALAEKLKALLIVTEGFSTYGGLAGRDLDAISQGLREVVDEQYLAHRINSVAHFGQMLVDLGIPVVQPFGGHAVYIDANKFLQDCVSPQNFPAHSLAIQLYIEGGIRTCGLGSFVFPESTDELVRIAVPRRVYAKEHFEYAVKVVAKVFRERTLVKGMQILKESGLMRHFSAELVPVEENDCVNYS
ncbi:tryptophanase [Folsomia candida]|nr:tryptophanase [Folsomia candida]